MKFIPVNRPLITKMEADSVAKCIKSGWISGDGPYVKKFEKEFAKTVSRKYAITVSNGTAALDIAIKFYIFLLFSSVSLSWRKTCFDRLRSDDMEYGCFKNRKKNYKKNESNNVGPYLWITC